MGERERIDVERATSSLLFSNIGNSYFKVNKNKNNILEIANDEYYKRVKFQYELLYILDYTIRQNLTKLYSVQIYTIYYIIC
jgi:hypothetical protein